MEYKVIEEKKKRLKKYRPFDINLVQNLEEWFRLELTYTSNAIEGNTLSRSETALVVEKGITIGGKSLVEHLEATNHVKALDFIRMQVSRPVSSLVEQDVLKIHQTILDAIDDKNAGFYRDCSVRISGSNVILPNPRKVPDLMKEFFIWLASEKDLHDVELAAEAHYRLVTIHPFIDGNGRTARLLMNMILLMKGYPEAIIRKRDRLGYINSLEKAQTGGSKDDYLKIIAKAVERSLDIYLNAVEGKEEKQPETKNKLLKIGQLAKQTGEANSTIRYWTKEGLLEAAEITKSGYHYYSEEMIDRVNKIKELKEKRLTLEEIRSEVSSG